MVGSAKGGRALSQWILSGFVIVFVLSATGCPEKAHYHAPKKYDKSDMFPQMWFTKDLKPVGISEPTEKVIDIRGFFPFGMTEAGRAIIVKSPSREVAMLLYPRKAENGPYPTVPESCPLLRESEAKEPEDMAWLRFAYALTKDEKGEELYAKLLGGSGFVHAQPVSLVFTKENVYTVVNFRWSSINEPVFDTGNMQTLIAVECSRNFKDAKACYIVYDRSIISKAGEESLRTVLPYIVSALSDCPIRGGIKPLVDIGTPHLCLWAPVDSP